MSKRVTTQTIPGAIKRFLPALLAKGVSEAATKRALTVRNLRDVVVGDIAVMDAAFLKLEAKDFIHRSVAAVYCRRAESTMDAHLGRLRKAGDITPGMIQIRMSREENGTHPHTYYRMDLIKKLAQSIAHATDHADDKRSKKAQGKAPAKVEATVGSSTLQDAVDTKVPWIADENGHLHIRAAVPGLDGALRLAKIFRDGGRIEMLTFQQAMTQRQWLDLSARAPWHAEYLRLLDQERARVEHYAQSTQALDGLVRFQRVVRPTRRKGKGGRF